MTQPTPPAWAEWALRLLVAPADRDSVSGDLLEEYREVVLPRVGVLRADYWYTREVAGFAWAENRAWIILFALSAWGRTAFDWLVPAADFHGRAMVTTATGVTLLLLVGFSATWRFGSITSGVLAGVVTTVAAGAIHFLGVVILLAVRHDPHTLAAIQSSGGLAEAITLPATMIVPGVGLGALGGIAADAMRRIQRRRLS